MTPRFLIIPGLGDSGTSHWQSIWLSHYDNTFKVIQNNWNQPSLTDWMKQLQDAIAKSSESTILIAHSLGAILVTHWAATNQNPNIIGAVLVAPADVDSSKHTPECIWNFAPIPTLQLTFPSIVVASENDPYMTLKRAKELAGNWGSQCINIGPKGHINTESNVGEWEEGKKILEEFIRKLL